MLRRQRGALRAEQRGPDPRVALTHVVQIATELIGLNNRCKQGVLTLLSELLLQNGNAVEVILERACYGR